MKRSIFSAVILAVAAMSSSVAYADVGAGGVGYYDYQPVYTAVAVMPQDPTDTVSAVKPNNDGYRLSDTAPGHIVYSLYTTTDNRIPRTTLAYELLTDIVDVPTKIPITV